uniref:Uncharacterized protein n=1 Tax=Knipowitschia caucasica TaxID=637954 RepID=A0AAV2LJQ7_KNICA
MDAESPDFVPSVFTYKQQASVPVQKIERLARKRRREALKMEQNGHSYTNEVLVPDEESADMDHVPLLHDRFLTSFCDVLWHLLPKGGVIQGGQWFWQLRAMLL